MRYTVFLASIVALVSCVKAPQGKSTVLTGPAFTKGIEGPATDKNGNVYIVNFEKEGTIGKIAAGDSVPRIFATLPNGSIGNGIRISDSGVLIVADYTGHNVLGLDPKTMEWDTLCHDTAMNQPNDLALMSNGIVLLSDPNWQNGTGNIWRLSNGKLSLLEDSCGTTNGIEVAPGDSILYVNESHQKLIWKYKLSQDGSISHKKAFFNFSFGGLDGMRCDKDGNLYVTRYDAGEVAIISPNGIMLKQIRLQGKKPTNITFAGKDRKTCYVTLQDKRWVEVFEALQPGRE